MAKNKVFTFLIIAAVIIGGLYIYFNPNLLKSSGDLQSVASVTSCTSVCHTCEDLAQITSWYASSQCAANLDPPPDMVCFANLQRSYPSEAARAYSDVGGIKCTTPLPTSVCTDTDSQNLFNKGSVSYTDNSGQVSTATDYCQDSNTVIEYVCNSYRAMYTPLSLACGNGYHCTDGACVENGYQCSDNDPTNDVHVYGSLTLGGVGVPVQYDSCTDYTHVRQYFCQATNFAFSDSSCGSTENCMNGVCAPGSCTQTSNSATLYSGSNSITKTDECAGPNAYNHYTCSGKVIATSTIQCGSGNTCYHGSCITHNQFCDIMIGTGIPECSGYYTTTTQAGVTCYDNTQIKCYGSNLYYFNSCGNVGNIYQICTNGCNNNACVSNAITIYLQGDTNSDGKIDRSELGVAINNWVSGSIDRTTLGTIIQGWIQS